MAGKKRRASCAGDGFTLAHSNDPPGAKKARSRRHSVWASEQVSVVVIDDDGPDSEIAIPQKPIRQRRSQQGQEPEAEVDGHRALQEDSLAKKARNRRGQPGEETEDVGTQPEVHPGKKTSGCRSRPKANVEERHAQPKDRPAKKDRKRRSGRVDETSLISTSEDLGAEAMQLEDRSVKDRDRRSPREDESDLQAESDSSGSQPEGKKARQRRDRPEVKVKEGDSQPKVLAAKKARNRRDRPEAEVEPCGTKSVSIPSKNARDRHHTRRKNDPAIQEHDAEVGDGGSKLDDNDLTKSFASISSKKARDRRRSQREDEPPVQKPDATLGNDGIIQSKRNRIKDSASCDRHCRRVDKALPPAAKEANADGGRTRKLARHNCNPRLTEPTQTVAKKDRDRRHRPSDVDPFPSVVVIDSDPEVQPPAKKRRSRRRHRDRFETSSPSEVEENELEILTKNLRDRRNRRMTDPTPRLYVEISDTESESARHPRRHEVDDPSSLEVVTDSQDLDDTCEVIEDAIECVDVEEEAEKCDLIDQIMDVVRGFYGFQKPAPEVSIKVEKEVVEAGPSASNNN